MANAIPTPPAGFVLDPIPPEGFVIDLPPEPSLWDKGVKIVKTAAEKVPDVIKAGIKTSAEAADVEGVVFESEALKKPEIVSDIENSLVGAGEAALALGSGAVSAITAPINKYIKTAQGKTESEAQSIAEEMAGSTTYQPQTELGKKYTEILGKALGLPFEVVENILAKPAKQMVEESMIGKLIKAAGGNPQLFGQLVDSVITFGGGGALFHGLTQTPKIAAKGANTLARAVAAKNLEASGIQIPSASPLPVPETGAGFGRTVPVRPTTSGPVVTNEEVKTVGEVPATQPVQEPGLMENQSTGGFDVKQEVRQVLRSSIEEKLLEQKRVVAGKAADKSVEKLAQLNEGRESPFVIDTAPEEVSITPKTDTSLQGHALDLISQVRDKVPTWTTQRLQELVQKPGSTWSQEDHALVQRMERVVKEFKGPVEGRFKAGIEEQTSGLVDEYGRPYDTQPERSQSVPLAEGEGKVTGTAKAEPEPETYTFAADEPVRLPSRGYMPRGEAGSIAIGSTKPGFYSKVEELVNMKMSGKMEAEQLKKMLKNNGATDAEIQSVLGELKGSVTKQQVLQEIEANKTELKDVELGGQPKGVASFEDWKANSDSLMELEKLSEESQRRLYRIYTEDFIRAEAEAGRVVPSPKFDQYVEPGAVPGSYRELFVTAPEAKGTKEFTRSEAVDIINGTYKGEGRWQDGHSAYSDIPNPVVRIRFNERDVNGKRILFVEEIQPPSKANMEKMPEALAKRAYDIGVKRVLSYAKENGFDGVAWTTGKMQVDRYNLSKYVEKLGYFKDDSGKYHISVEVKSGPEPISEMVLAENELVNNVGKDLADKIIKGEGAKEVYGDKIFKTLSGLDLEIGGEGLKTLYDKTLPALFKKYGKEEVKNLDLPANKAEKEPASGRVIGEELGIPEESISDWWRELDQEVRDDLIKDYYTKAAKETIGVPYIPISSKTPSAYTLYSGVNPFELPKVVKDLSKSVKQTWDEQTAGTTVRLTGRDLLDFFKEPERVMKREEPSKQAFKALATAEEEKNAFIYRNYTEYEKALKGIKKNSLEDRRVARALDGQVDENGVPYAENLTKNEQKAYDFFKQNFEAMITEFARRSAGSEEAYQKVLRLVASKNEKRAKVSELGDAERAAYEELNKQASDLRGTRKVSELVGEERQKYQAIQQEKRDLLSKKARNKLTEGEREAFDILSRKINDYLPHLFDKDEMLKLFKDEIVTLTDKLNKSTNKSVITNTKNRLAELEAAVKKMEGGQLVTFESLPSNIFFRFFSPRRGKEGYALSAMQAYETYLFGLARKMFDEPAVKKISKDYYNQMSPDMQEYTKAIVNHYMGYDNKRPRLDKLAGTITSFEWMRTLGLNPRSALANLTQRINTAVYAGEKYALLAEKMMLLDRQHANAIFDQSGITREVPHVLTEGTTPKGMEAMKSIVGYLFNAVELGNRKHAYLSGYLKGLDVGAKRGLTNEALDSFARKEATKTVHKTQFRYGALGMPRATWSPMGRIALQFGSYPLKQAGFIYDLMKKDPVAFAKYLGYTIGGNVTLQQLFDTDLSNALGIGLSLGEAAAVVKEIAEGDLKGAARHLKQVIEPGAGLLPSGPGPMISSVLNLAGAAREGKALEQFRKELTPVMMERLRQFDQAKKVGDQYLISNTEDHATYRLNRRQLYQRTFGPKTFKEGQQIREQTAERNLEIERKQGLESVVDAFLSGDREKFRSAVMANKEAVALVLKTPGGFDRLVENEQKRRMLTKPERQKPTSVQNMYQFMREGAPSN